MYLTCLCLAAAGISEDALGWSLGGVWLFLATSLIYTPDLIHVELITWSSLGAHLVMMVLHASTNGTNAWLSASTGFVNTLAVLMGSAPLAAAGFILGIVQSSVKDASGFHHAALALSVLPLFDVLIAGYRRVWSK